MRIQNLLKWPVVVALLGMSSITPTQATELVWSAPDSCPNRQEVELEIERLLRAPLTQFGEGFLDAHVRSTDPGYVARLELSSNDPAQPRAVRAFRAETCNELVDVIALSIALSLGLSDTPGSVLPPERASANQPLSTVTRPAPLPQNDESKQEPTPQGTRPGSALFFALTGDTGSLPGPTVGLAMGIELSWSAAHLRLFGTWFAPQRKAVNVAISESIGAEINLMTASLQACSSVSAPHASLPLSVCGGLELGQLAGHGIGISTPRTSRSQWAALRFDLETHFQPQASSFRYFAGVGMVAPLVRDVFILRNVGTVYQAGSLVGRAHLGAFLPFL